MMKTKLTATRIQLILSFTLVLVVVLGGIGFSIINSELDTFAIDVSHKVADANASRDNVQNLQKIERQLTDKQAAIQKVDNIVAESKSYQYQDQIITDLNNYAARAGVAITNISFTDTQTSGNPAAGAPAPSTSTPNGIKSSSATITLNNPIDYLKLLKFIAYIEQNLTKMQISRVNLSKDASGKSITSDALVIEVYVK
jgi:hypothetical protein